MLKYYQMVKFSEWLANQLRLKDMTIAELARASNKAPAVISRILSNERNPEPETLIAIARGLNLSAETVFRAAGLLPPAPPDTEYEEQILYLLRQLPLEEQKRYLELLLFEVERQKVKIQKSREKPPARSVLKDR